MTGSAQFSAGQEMIGTAVRVQQRPAAGQPLVVAVDFDVAEGFHVYADDRFRVQIQDHDGLDAEYEVEMPSTIDITDPFGGFPPKKVTVFEGQQELLLKFHLAADDDPSWRLDAGVSFQACSDQICLPPETLHIQLASVANEDVAAAIPGSVSADSGGWENRGLILGMFAAFAAGLALSLTPCVYPMIGITVAVIGGQRASRGRSLALTALYVMGLSLTYALAGVVVASLGATAADFFRSPWVLGVVAVVFFALGLSMFDLFSIATPSAMNQRLQKIGGNGSVVGVFLMGCLSAFVVGPCVSAPLLGLITYVATTGDQLVGFLYFFVLAWGMGSVLFMAGAASNLLPRAGVWMVRIKHVLGVVILWAAVYFARPILGELAFFAATLALVPAALVAAGAIQFPNPEDGHGIKVRKVASFLLALLFLTGIDAFILARIGSSQALGIGIDYTVDLQAELDQGKPVLLDFWAPWCAICKEIERDVLNDPELQDELADVNLVKVHYDFNEELRERFGLIGPPAFVVLSTDNQPMSPVIVGKEELRRFIEDRGWLSSPATPVGAGSPLP